MLTIRLSRTGKTKQPYYRIIVLEKSKDPWGDYKELLGNYNPRSKELVIKEDRIKYWVSVGAQMSNTVHNLMIKNNVIEEKPRKAVKISKKRTAKLEAKKKEVESTPKDEAPKDEVSTEEPKSEEVKESASAEATTDGDDKEETPVEESEAEAPADKEVVEEKE
ncbi:MAG: 30S ribosomal protein S16 [Candidatus Komeilibacteria bacterium]